MRAFCVLGKGQVGWKDLPDPTPGPRDCIVRPTVITPCTSDVNIVDTLPDAYKNIIGAPLGHEGVGIVTEIGSQVKDIAVGDRVAGFSFFYDFTSPASQMGISQYNPPDNYYERLAQYGGTFAERIYVHEADSSLARIPDAVTDLQAVMVSDMMATPFTQAEQANINYGDTVVVMGIGPVGLMGICAARLKGAARIIAIGSRPATFERATEYGATDLVNYREGNVVDQVLALTGPEKADSVLICGGESGQLGEALAMLRAGGTVSNVALFLEETTEIPNSVWGFGCTDGKTITGTQLKAGRQWLSKLLRLIEYGLVDPSSLCSHEYHGFASIEQAYEKMSEKTPDLIKPVVYVDDLV
jgi:threonine dehydrogenase-like Zn-dependent dehydrogenase